MFGAINQNLPNGKAACFAGLARLRWEGDFARQLLEFFKSAALIFQQAFLTLTNQALITRIGLDSSMGRIQPGQTRQQPR
ncbi:hypothetical protein D9M71_727690 [compost metagenome]